MYEKVQDFVDRSHGVFRVMGICFKMGESDFKIRMVVDEVLAMKTRPPALMTAEALYKYIDCSDEQLLASMYIMPINSSFYYKNLLITRCSKSTYNARAI